MRLIAELKRRNVIRVAIFYIVSAWLFLQIADLLFEVLLVPDWTLRFLFGALLVAFPFVLFFAWAYELTPEGIKKEAEVDRSDSVTQETGRKLDYITMVLVLLGVGFVLVDRFLFEPEPAIETPSAGFGGDRAAGGRSVPGGRAREARPELSIAVLPFANMSASEENEYFADGLTEELLNMLAQIETLKVAGRTSSFYFKGKNENLQTIGEQLNVAHVLEGSVRRSGDRLRITAQLIKVEDGYHLWSGTYDRVLDDVFAIQEEIAESIGEALKLKLELLPNPRNGQTDNIEAYTLYLEGRQKWNNRVIEDLEDALGLFRRAVEIEPNYALAWSGLADTIDALAWRVPSTRKLVPEGIDAARRAIELAPRQAAGYASLGVLQAEFLWELEAAEANYQKALELNPVYVPALHWYSDALRVLGRLEEALSMCMRAIHLDPLAPILHSVCGSVAFDLGQDERGIELFLAALELSPDIVNLNFSLAVMAHAFGGWSTDAAAPYLVNWARIRNIPRPERVTLILEAREDPGKVPQALELLNEIKTTDAAQMELVALYAHIGQFEPALDALEAAQEAGEAQILYSSTWRRLPPELRDHPRFEAVVREIGIPTRREIENR